MLKDILKEFDKKFIDKKYGGLKSIDSGDVIKQFLSDKIKEAMESVVPEKYVSEAKFVDVILYGEPKGYNSAIDQISNNIKEFYETKN